jgi:hypothetical protein
VSAASLAAVIDGFLLLAAFLFANAFRHALVGAIASLAVAAVVYLPLGASAYMTVFFSRDVRLHAADWSMLAAVAVGALPATGAAGLLTLPSLARGARFPWRRRAATLALVLAPLAASLLAFRGSVGMLQASRELISLPPGQLAERRVGEFYGGADGSLVFREPSGAETLLVPGEPGLLTGRSAVEPFPRFDSAWWDGDGIVAAWRKTGTLDGPAEELWRGVFPGPLRVDIRCPHGGLAGGCKGAHAP